MAMNCDYKVKPWCEKVHWEDCWDEPDTTCFERWEMEPWQVGDLIISSKQKLSRLTVPPCTTVSTLPFRNTSTRRSASCIRILLTIMSVTL